MTERMIYRTEATRERIISGAKALFVEFGFSDTQMKYVASAVGVSRNTLYRYYRDKYDLGFAILVSVLSENSRLQQELLDAIAARQFSTVLAGLETLMNRWINPASRDNERFIAEFDSYYAGNRIPEKFRVQLTNSLPKNLTTRLQHIIVIGQQEGSIRDDMPAHYLAVTLFNAVPTFFRRMLLRENALMEIEHSDIPKLSPLFIRLLIDGLKPRPKEYIDEQQ